MGTINDIDLSHRDGPKYKALGAAITEMVTTGDLKPGDKMPPVRELAWSIGVTPGTVARAYQVLIDRSVLKAHVGRGTFVSGSIPDPASAGVDGGDGIIDFKTPTLPEVGQDALIRTALQAAARLPLEDLMNYPTDASDLEARKAVLARIDSFDTTNLSPDHVVLSNGGQHAFSLILAAVLKGPEPTILIEEMAYTGFRHAARQARAKYVPITLDEQGPTPTSVRKACQEHEVQILTTSGHAQNPTTITTTPERRQEIVDLAREFDFQIVDDQCYSLITQDRPSYRDLAPERVWFISAFSKWMSPALRIGYFIAPEGKAGLGQKVAQHAFFRLSVPNIEVARLVLTDPKSLELRQKCREVNQSRVDILREAMQGYDLRSRRDAAFAFLYLPAGWRASRFQRAAEAKGILLRNADEYILSGGWAPNAVRIAINGRIPETVFEEGCAVLKGLLDAPPHEIGV